MIVAFTVSCLRQKYLRLTLDSWFRARGVRECKAVFALEPPPRGMFPVEEFSSFAARSFPAGASAPVASEGLGCLKNTRRAVELALEQEDFGIVAEEDIEVSDDVLEYFSWASEAYRSDPQVLAVCAHARGARERDASAVTRAPWFNPLVWGTWRDRWEKVIGPTWQAMPDSGNPESWDRNLMRVTKEGGYSCVFPILSRSIHLGQSSTQISWPLSDYFFEQSRSGCFAPHYEPQSYREVGYPAHLVV